MTRLRQEWIREIESELKEYEKDLKKKTGLSLVELAAFANGITARQIQDAARCKKIAVVPVSAGQGIIGMFSETVSAILAHMGFSAFVTTATDVAGIYEAHQGGGNCVFLADDARFIACDFERNRFSENDRATAAGYVAALAAACGGIRGKSVLLLGYGQVGREMFSALVREGAKPMVYDKDPAVLLGIGEALIVKEEKEIGDFKLILDATNEGAWITRDMLNREVWISTPGIPLSLDEKAYARHKDRVIHDYLQIGTAVMMGELCK